MENRRKLQLRLRCGHDSMFVLSYVLYNDYSCVFTVKDELDQQSFRMVSNCFLGFESYFEFEDVIQYCSLVGVSFLMWNLVKVSKLQGFFPFLIGNCILTPIHLEKMLLIWNRLGIFYHICISKWHLFCILVVELGYLVSKLEQINIFCH